MGIPQEDGAEHLPVIPVDGEGQEDPFFPTLADFAELERRSIYFICENSRLRGQIALNDILVNLRKRD